MHRSHHALGAYSLCDATITMIDDYYVGVESLGACLALLAGVAVGDDEGDAPLTSTALPIAAMGSGWASRHPTQVLPLAQV